MSYTEAMSDGILYCPFCGVLIDDYENQIHETCRHTLYKYVSGMIDECFIFARQDFARLLISRIVKSKTYKAYIKEQKEDGEEPQIISKKISDKFINGDFEPFDEITCLIGFHLGNVPQEAFSEIIPSNTIIFCDMGYETSAHVALTSELWAPQRSLSPDEKKKENLKTIHVDSDIPCVGCGYCCLKARCVVSLQVYRTADERCPALKWTGERYVCELAFHDYDPNSETEYFDILAIDTGCCCSKKSWRLDVRDRG